jgi:hypothetical protein
MSKIDEDSHATFARLSQRFGIPMPQDAWDRAKAGIPSGPGISYMIDDDDGPTHHDWDDAVHAYLDACEEIPEGPVEIQPCKAPEVTEWMREEAARAAEHAADNFDENFTADEWGDRVDRERLRQRIEDAFTLALALTIKPNDVTLAEGFGKPYVMPEEDVVSLWCAELVEAFDEKAAVRALEARAAKVAAG